jgi:hypothetical protein
MTAILLASVTTGHAQDPRKTEAMKRIEMLRVWRLTEILDLTAEDGIKIFPLLRKYDGQLKKKGQEKERLVRKMHQELKKETVNSANLSKMTQQILRVESEAIQIRKAMYKELETVFTPEQIARYMIFEVSFQKEIDEIISQVRRERSQRQPSQKHPNQQKK